MKNYIIAASCFLFAGCHFSTVTTQYFAPDDTIPGTTTTKSFYTPEGSKGSCTSTQQNGDTITRLRSTYQFTSTPSPEIKIGFELEQGNTRFSDTIRTAMFTNLIELKDVKKILLDSITYRMDQNEVKVRFRVLLDRLPNNSSVIKEKYTTVYSSALQAPSTPLLQLEKVEKTMERRF